MNIRRTLHKAVYHIGLFIARFTLIKYHFTHSKRLHLTEPTLVLCNHTTESDMIMVASCFYEHMYIVCGEHLLRSKFGKPIQALFAPIPACKGASHLPTVKAITKSLKAGNSLMLFPEGSRNFTGITEPQSDSTGKLVKIAKCGLATVHTQGGYFIAPRWAHHFKKGPVSAEVRHILTAEEVSKMSVKEITELINKDLYEDAYASQRINHHRYTGEGLAEGLENYLVICPECGAYDSLSSSGNKFFCTKCGASGIYTEEGFLEGTAASSVSGNKFGFDSVSAWGKWMETRFDEDMKDKAPEDLLFTETDVRLYSIDASAHTSTDICTGTLTAYIDRIVMTPSDTALPQHEFRFSDISETAMLYYGRSLLFTHPEGYLALTGEHFHAWKESRLYLNYTAAHAPSRKMNAQ